MWSSSYGSQVQSNMSTLGPVDFPKIDILKQMRQIVKKLEIKSNTDFYMENFLDLQSCCGSLLFSVNPDAKTFRKYNIITFCLTLW